MSISANTEHIRQPLALAGFAIECTLLIGISIPAYGGPWFDDVTSGSGLQYTGPSFGASWGDSNGDGWPDLWVGNHAIQPSLFENNKNGTFTNRPPHLSDVHADMHGSAWADFDNDGDQDLFIAVGAQFGTGFGANELLVNIG
jgi:hypothetical protein